MGVARIQYPVNQGVDLAAEGYPPSVVQADKPPVLTARANRPLVEAGRPMVLSAVSAPPPQGQEKLATPKTDPHIVEQYVQNIQDPVAKAIAERVKSTPVGQRLLEGYAQHHIVLGNLAVESKKNPELKPLLKTMGAITTPELTGEKGYPLTGKVQVLLNPRFLNTNDVSVADINGTLANELVNARQYVGMLDTMKTAYKDQPFNLQTAARILEEKGVDQFRWEVVSTLADVDAVRQTAKPSGKPMTAQALMQHFQQKYKDNNIFAYFMTSEYAEKLGIHVNKVFSTQTPVDMPAIEPNKSTLKAEMRQWAPEFAYSPELLNTLDSYFNLAAHQAAWAMAAVQNSDPCLPLKEKQKRYVQLVMQLTQPMVDDLLMTDDDSIARA